MKRSLQKLVLLCLLAALFMTTGCQFLQSGSNAGQLSIALQGDPQMQVEYGSVFDDPGAVASWDGTLHVDVTRTGKVDTSRLGLQKLKYTAQYQSIVRTIYRNVFVVDTVAPTIELLTAPDHYTLPGQPYVEEGYTATDNCDGNLTDKVTRTEGDGTVTYTVTDSSGNTATVTRTILYNDTLPPVLTLQGEAEMRIPAGTKFADPGCTATDNADGDISDKVTVTGELNIYLPGTYTLTYTATDTWGNQTSIVRKVTVTARSVATPVSPSGKVIYLTFDDGPGPYTSQLLDVLSKYNIKATFFVVNSGYISLTERMAKEGHTVAIHSATHKYSQIYANEDAYFADLEKMQGIIEDYTGKKPMMLRFPGGGSNAISSEYNKGIMTRLTKAVKAQGYRYFDWNVDSDDAGRASTADQVFNNVINGIGNKRVSIVLQHDIKDYSVEAVEGIINWGLANGYTFLPLTMDSPECEHRVFN